MPKILFMHCHNFLFEITEICESAWGNGIFKRYSIWDPEWGAMETTNVNRGAEIQEKRKPGGGSPWKPIWLVCIWHRCKNIYGLWNVTQMPLRTKTNTLQYFVKWLHNFSMRFSNSLPLNHYHHYLLISNDNEIHYPGLTFCLFLVYCLINVIVCLWGNYFWRKCQLGMWSTDEFEAVLLLKRLVFCKRIWTLDQF